MTIPFRQLVKKLTDRFGSTSTEGAPPPPPPVTTVRAPKKSAGERMSKTVMPNATRSLSSHDPFRSAAGMTSGRAPGAPMQLGSQRITAAPRRPQASSLPPALARALEPKLERTVSLCILDFIDSVPPGYIKPVEILDAAARVSLKASEIERGMAEKNPTILLPNLYQQVPEIFLKGVRPDDTTRVALPYDKVLAQFAAAQVRSDQLRDPAVPQVDTPILKATMQDSEKFGTKIEPIEASALPSVPVEPATAKAIADAEPEAVVQETTKSTPAVSPGVSTYSPVMKPKIDPTAPKSPSQTGSPSRTAAIPFDLSPNGTGGSASERVPASSGPPVPTPLPFTPEPPKIPLGSLTEKVNTPETKKPAPGTTAKAPLKLTETPAKKPQPRPAPASKPESKPARAQDETPIKLSLKTVLQNLPAFQLTGDVAAVAADAQFSLPLSLIEPQLATGRVSIAPDVFQNALPEQYREMFQIDQARTVVALPLEEVLKNLPATILKLRDDQEQTAIDKDFETPFSTKAKEDAQRLSVKAEKKTPEKPKEEPAAEAKIDIPPAAEKKIDPKEVVAQVSAFPGVRACAITFADGLSLAGELPKEISAEGLCAVAPSILERVAQHLRATKLGSLSAVTFYTSDSAVSFFAHGNICLTALHSGDSLSPKTRAEIADLAEKLSKTYTQPEK